MSEPELDDSCKIIVSFLLVHRDKIRFNRLHRTLNAFNFKISKPTLSKHLKHLLEKELIIRNIEGEQNISYNINYDRFRRLPQFRDAQMAVWKYHDKTMENFGKLSLDEKIKMIHDILILNGLFILKLEFLKVYEPESMLEQGIIYTFTMWTLLPYIKTFTDDLRDRETEYQNEALNKLKELSDSYIDTIFENIN